jgi:hypothetical protein
MGYGRNAGCAAFLLGAALIILSGCQTVLRPSDGGTSTPDIIGESRSDGAARDQFKNRSRLPLCQDIVLSQGEGPGSEGLECLKRGYANDGAELAVARPTAEGDMIVSYFQIMTHSPSLQIFRDTTRDKFGSGKWEEAVCSLPHGADSIAACIGWK